MIKNDSVDFLGANASRQFVDGLQKNGYCFIKNCGLAKTELVQFYDYWQQFFLSDDKFDFQFTPKSQNGYYPLEQEHARTAQVNDYKDFFHYYPSGKSLPPDLAEITHSLYTKFFNIAKTLLNWIDNHTPLHILQKFSIPLSSMLDQEKKTLLRILHYPPLKTENKIRAAQHEDIDLITLMPCATTSGLEIKNKAGNWIKTSCSENSILVIIGDMLQLCSDNYYRATTHRVVDKNATLEISTRLASAFFVHPKPEVMLTETLNAQTLFDKRMQEIGLHENHATE